MRMRNLCLVSLAAAVLAGCGGGSGSSSTGNTITPPVTTATSALTIANKVSGVDPNQTNGGIGKAVSLAVSFPDASDYMKDKTNVYVQEGSTDAFRTVNEILCSMGQTGYDSMLNKGDYKALVDKKLCSGGTDQNANAGQNAGAGAPDFQEFTVNSSRPDNSSPQIVKLWIHEKARNSDPAKAIVGRAEITEASSTTNPLGQFTMNFVAYPLKANGTANSSAQPLFKGFLKTVKDTATGQTSLQFGSQDLNQGPYNNTQLAALQRSSDGASGSGSVNRNTNGTIESQNIAYNSLFFHRKNASEDVCLDRGKFETSAWRYGLYNSNGARVDRNSGFPIKLADGSSGWMGYWGLWLQGNGSIANGATVTKQGFNGAADATYTALVAGGKMKKHTRQSTTLGAIKNIPLDGWMEMTNANPPQSVNYRVIWNGTNFVKIAKFDQTANTYTDIPNGGTAITGFTNQNINLWSQSVGGQVIINLTCTFTPPAMGQQPTMSCTAPTDSMQVVYYSEDIVYPNDPANPIPAKFACANGCIDPANISTSSPFFAESGFFNEAPVTAVDKLNSYSFDGSSYVLKSGASQLTSTTTAQQWGVQTGPLFDPTVAGNIAALACDNNPNQTCTWNAWSKLNVFYTWETGGNPFNQFTALKDTNGKFLTFDPPLQIKYTYVATGNTSSDAKYGGTAPATFALDYAGFGQLNGIPGKCVDMRDGNLADCSSQGNNQNIRWVPEFIIPEASTVASGSTTYYVKPLDVEQRMKKATAGSCAALTTTTLALPLMSEFADPTSSNGAEPAISSAPAVIAGVVK